MGEVVSLDLAKHFPNGPVAGEFPFEHNGRRIILLRDFVYVDVIDGTQITLIIPKGFVSDFNSTPRPLWIWFPPWECPEAAVPHDWKYQYPGDDDRAFIDRMHRRLMELKGERKSKRVAAWLGIRAGGRRPWNRYRRAAGV